MARSRYIKKIASQIISQIGNYINDQLHAENKQENRAKACFKSLEEKGIKICNATTREVIPSITETLEKARCFAPNSWTIEQPKICARRELCQKEFEVENLVQYERYT